MVAIDLIDKLRRNGYEIRTDGDYLDISPAENISPALVLQLKQNKSELLAELKRETRLDPSLPQWAWRLSYADGTTKEIYTLPEATHAEVMQLWPEVVAAEPFERVASVASNEPTPDWLTETTVEPKAEIDPCAIDPSDNRRCCVHCSNLTRQGKCLAAFRGEILASRNFSPVKDQFHRCVGYKPSHTDPDQRTVAERWPGLIESDAAARKRYAEPPL